MCIVIDLMDGILIIDIGNIVMCLILEVIVFIIVQVGEAVEHIRIGLKLVGIESSLSLKVRNDGVFESQKKLLTIIARFCYWLIGLAYQEVNVTHVIGHK